jgi:hypothetical protein
MFVLYCRQYHGNKIMPNSVKTSEKIRERSADTLVSMTYLFFDIHKLLLNIKKPSQLN